MNTATAVAAGLALLLLAPSARASIKLSTEVDQCGDDDLKIVDAGGKRVRVSKGDSSGAIPVDSRNIAWFCGGSDERTTCPKGTNEVVVTRDKDGRRFETACRVKGMGLLEKTGEKCSADWLKVFRSKEFPPPDGSWGLQLDKGQQREGEMEISSRKFLWMCMTGKQWGEIKLVVGGGCSKLDCPDGQGNCTADGCGPRLASDLDSFLRIFGLDGPDDYTGCPLHTNFIKVEREKVGSRFWVSCFAKE
jgi:hypothetical protein